MQASSLPGWSTFGTSGLKNLVLPEPVKWVIALAENDGGPSDKALDEFIHRSVSAESKSMSLGRRLV